MVKELRCSSHSDQVKSRKVRSMEQSRIDILSVEDNDDDILLTEEVFSEGKLINVIHAVRDGEEALQYLRRQGQYANISLPGLVMLDLNMPKMNGLEVLVEIKKDHDIRHIPVVVLTTSERENDIVKSYEFGACSYIKKPVQLSDFKDALHQFELYWALVARIPGTGK